MTSETLYALKDLLSLEDAVSFRVFVSSSDYCDNKNLWEYWYQQESLLSEDLSELILDGSLGGGKSTFAAYYFAYRIYLLFFSGSPQRRLGLPLNADLYCLYFSVSMTTAKRSGYQLIYDIFKTCKWFKDNAPINENLKSSIEFVDKHFFINYASDFGHQLSLNVWGFILDEANFRGGVGNGVESQYAEVVELYQQLLDRQISRFAKPDGTVDALAILISSASYQSSFVEKRKTAIKNDSHAKVITSLAYLVKPERFSSEKFEVFIGSGLIEPAIIESEDHKKTLLTTSGILGTGEEEFFIKKVPINLLKAFKTNIVLALQNHCGVPTLLSSTFMSNLKFLYDSYVDDILPIFQSFELEASTSDDTSLIEYLIPENIQYPERPHSLFLDLSVQHDTGSLVCYRYDGRSEKGDMHTRLFSLKIVPPKYPAQTRINKVQQLVIDLSQYLNIVAFASDQYQSTQIRQEITQQLGLEDIRISIDSSDLPHLHWQRGLVEGRIKQIRDEYLEREVREAIHDWKKHRVLKATNSSDDVLQGNVGAFYLSDTFAKNSGTLIGLSGPLNLVGGKSISTVLKQLGYSSVK